MSLDSAVMAEGLAQGPNCPTYIPLLSVSGGHSMFCDKTETHMGTDALPDSEKEC
jgi:hypothetical protein